MVIHPSIIKATKYQCYSVVFRYMILLMIYSDD